MSQKIHEALSQVAVETFEKLAFMFAFPEDDVGSEDIEHPIYGQVRFSGPFSGMLTIVISSAVLPELAANMLGLDEETRVTQEERHDALKETINVICGNLLPVVAGPEHIFNMETPRVMPQNEDPQQDALARVGLSFDEGACVIGVSVDGEIPKQLLRVDVPARE